LARRKRLNQSDGETNQHQMNNHTITPEQRQRLIAAYQRTGNMAAAMREAGIKSPRTAYLWWHRYTEGGAAALQPRSHARHTQQRLPDAVVEHICQLRRQEPHWGRRRIASALTQFYGRQVASPSSVEAVLGRAGLWEPATQPTAAPQPPGIPFWLRGAIEYDRLLETVQKGIRLDVQGAARAATQVLYQQVWRPLEDDPALWSRLLTTSQVGSWLLRSRLQLGHSLMNSGNWPLAARYLQETIDWMQEHPIGPRQRAWEEEEPRWASVRRDDVWIECYQYLGIVLREADLPTASAYMQTALTSVHHPHRPVVPGDESMVGNLERDLAKLQLRLRRLPEEAVRQHLRNAQESAERSGSPGMQAATQMAWAQLHDRLAREAGGQEQGTRHQQHVQMEQAIERALHLVEQEDSPILQTIFFVDAAQLFQGQGMPVDGQQVQRAARYCLTYGYGDQAQNLLAIPGIQTWLSEEVRRKLTSLSKP
jgi:transposase-like protein